MRMLVKLPSITNVAAGSTATLNCPIGRSYDRLILECENLTRTQIKNLRVEIDGKPIQEYKDAVQLGFINSYYGRFGLYNDTLKKGFVSIWFNRPEMNSLEHQRVTRLGTTGVQTFQVSFDIADDAVNPIVIAHAVQSDPSPLGMITKVKQFVMSAATAGKFEIDSIPKGPRIFAVHFFKPDVKHIEIEQNSRKIREGTKEFLSYVQRESGRKPIDSSLMKATSLDFTLEADLYHSLETNPQVIKDQRFRLDLETAGEVRVVVEYLDFFAGI